ncbi:hypothetical protein C8F04DRAFT_1269860 [Mycena alexandri]|uniref:CxC2-like cysteine cluster KDZ transposase-associated domain-containing protein n=1 Tax=Mycena alexandri TaxID=1745969 RepID=A0AAD6SBU3_9AGAR|nr:hypothetical protein C8F04DRAFT_1269860 [Mycena alexandri]
MTGRRRHRARGGAPSMYEHRPDSASVVRISDDGRRAHDRAVRVERVTETPAYFMDDPATNAALDSADFDYAMGDTGLPSEEQGPDSDGISVRVKAKRYQNSDLPFQTWVGHRDEYLDETLRLEGRGDYGVYSTCGGCGAVNPLFRCEHQSCYGPGMFCQTCIVARHEVLPTHWIQEWTGDFFRRVGLSTLGLVVQLGHTPGSACPAMRRGKYKFTLIDVTGIHNVAVQFCECDARITHRQQLMRVCWWPATVRDPSTCATLNVIRLFEQMNCLGKVSAFHFLRSLESLTNADGLNPLPNRRRAFMYIVRQRRMTEMYKRAGRGHANSRIAGTKQGELALDCRSCPQPGKNLPDGWQNINWAEMPEDLRYKYFLFLAQDCNFRLINRNVSSEARDPIIDDGLGYFCNREEYKKFLAKHVDEEEISTCSGFQAMFLANAKRVKGLRMTGVGGVCCARHNMWRPNGIGDLQRGERQSNMDFIVFSAVLYTIILYLILSYDIACQYGKKFWERMKGLPATMQLDMDKIAVWFKVPNFHMLGHKWPCHSPFSFHWMWGAGMTDGEVVEQNWEFTNGAAGSTKMMGPGGRHAFLEGLFAYHNWMRTVSYRKVFSRRMARDLKEGRQHREAFEAFTALVAAERPDLVEKWRAWVKEWESKQHTDGTASPFEMSRPVHTMKDIRLRLGKEELTRTGAGVEVERQHTSSTFVTLGLELEQSQRILAIDIKALVDPSPLQELELVKRKTALLKRISRFRKLQRTYMPELVRFLTPPQRELWDDQTRSPEAVKLFMPSELSAQVREQTCERGLAAIEEEMREGELQETLEELRDALRGVLRQITIRVHKSKLRYRYARNVLARLRGHGPWEKVYRVLEEGDVRGINERAMGEEELAERETLRELGAIVEGGIAAAGGVAAGEGRHTMSWIWRSINADTAEEELVDALRVEWCRAYARMRRWHEDIVLVEEEMRRTIEYGAWMGGQWQMRATARTEDLTPALSEGLRAYTLEHVKREEDTCLRLAKQWVGLRERARVYLAGVPEEVSTMTEIVIDVGVEDVDPSDDEGDVPGDELVEEDGIDGIDEEGEDGMEED